MVHRAPESRRIVRRGGVGPDAAGAIFLMIPDAGSAGNQSDRPAAFREPLRAPSELEVSSGSHGCSPSQGPRRRGSMETLSPAAPRAFDEAVLAGRPRRGLEHPDDLAGLFGSHRQ